MKTTKTTSEIFEDLEQDAINIACLGAHLLEEIKTRDKEIKTRDKKIKELELRLEEIGRV